jgi:adenylylsulfate kinase
MEKIYDEYEEMFQYPTVKKAVLFAGRFQPPHAAHIEIARRLIAEGKFVWFGIKDTEIDIDNPLRYAVRDQAIREQMSVAGFSSKHYGIRSLPMFEEIAVGRTPGHKLIEVELPDEFKNISGTAERKKMVATTRVGNTADPFCLWLYGMPNSGKSTLAYNLVQDRLRNCVIFDGDRFRERVTPELSFSREHIHENNLTAIKCVKSMMDQGFNCIVAMITPYEEMRRIAKDEIKNCKMVWVFAPDKERAKRPNYRKSEIEFEAPKRFDLYLNTQEASIFECCTLLYRLVGR